MSQDRSALSPWCVRRLFGATVVAASLTLLTTGDRVR